MDEMADDVIELLDALQLREPVVLGGLSMGGYVALSAVAALPRAVPRPDADGHPRRGRHARGRRNREELADQVESSGRDRRRSSSDAPEAVLAVDPRDRPQLDRRRSTR